MTSVTMLFNSPEYFVFLGVAVTLFWALRERATARLAVLFALSSLFYMAWNPRYIGLILLSGGIDYVIALQMSRTDDERKRKALLVMSLVANLGLLGTFKYFNFFMTATSQTVGLFGYSLTLPHLDVLLPVGISFYTFQTMSYSVDVYRRHLEPCRSPLEFLLYVTYFPQLVAGPIVRASEFLPQLVDRPKLRAEQVSDGLFLIITGLVKKVVVADFLSVNLVDRVFDNPDLYTAPEVVIGLYGFTMQMYCDFSGYTDVARGSAKLMGLELPENFDRPYQATNPADYWRRWHMTLSTWLRDYLYYPLGGSRVGPVRAYFNLFITFFLIGIWHGASWNFVLYAILQGTAMVLHRFVVRRRGRPKDAPPDAFALMCFKVFLSLQFVVFSRILFRASDFDNAVAVTARLWSGTSSMAQISSELWLVLIVSFALHFTPRRWFEGLRERFVRLPAEAQGLTVAGAFAGLALVATSEVVPYIYFQF